MYTEGAKRMYTHFKKGKNCIKIVILNIPITKDELKSCLTSAVITRGSQIGYHQRLDTSDYGELLLCIHFCGTSCICTHYLIYGMVFGKELLNIKCVS
jgi:hypothetical protein